MFKIIRALFKSSSPDILRLGQDNTHWIGGEWGSRIEWTQPNTCIVGWKTPKPKKGDWLLQREDKRIHMWKIGSIEHAHGVHDMFFAPVTDHGFLNCTCKGKDCPCCLA